MRLVLALVLLALLADGGAAPSHPETVFARHSPSVTDASHDPSNPGRGEGVRLGLALAPNASISSVKAIYCRVEGYACGPALNMTAVGATGFQATIPWHNGFFRGVRQVGYQFDIRHENGSVELSPLEAFPSRPATLPAEAGAYYFYDLPEESPGAGAAALVLAVLVLVVGRRWA